MADKSVRSPRREQALKLLNELAVEGRVGKLPLRADPEAVVAKFSELCAHVPPELHEKQ